MEFPVRKLTVEQQRLVEGAQGIAIKVAQKFRGRGEPIQELIAISFMGLCMAARSFDPEFGVKFSTYAWKACHSALQLHFRNISIRIHPIRFSDIESVKYDGRFEPVDMTDRSDGRFECDAVIREAIDRLPPRIALIIMARMSGYSLTEIGQSISRTKERVRQLEVVGHRQLRKMLADLEPTLH